MSETEAKAMLVWFINKWLGNVSCESCDFREYCGDNSNGGSCRRTVFDEVLKELQHGHKGTNLRIN